MVSLPFSNVQSTTVGSEVSAPSANSDEMRCPGGAALLVSAVVDVSCFAELPLDDPKAAATSRRKRAERHEALWKEIGWMRSWGSFPRDMRTVAMAQPMAQPPGGPPASRAAVRSFDGLSRQARQHLILLRAVGVVVVAELLGFVTVALVQTGVGLRVLVVGGVDGVPIKGVAEQRGLAVGDRPGWSRNSPSLRACGSPLAG